MNYTEIAITYYYAIIMCEFLKGVTDTMASTALGVRSRSWKEREGSSKGESVRARVPAPAPAACRRAAAPAQLNRT